MKTKLIAEIGLNHNGSLEIAKKMCSEAKRSGAHFAKFQTYSSEKRALPSSNIFQILKRCELSYAQQKDIKAHCDLIGIEFLSTPFDEEALQFLVNDLGCDKIKIASFYLADRVFLDKVNEIARTKPLTVFLSTGMSSPIEVAEALDHLNEVSNLTLLHCVSSYPTPTNAAHLAAIRVLSAYSKPNRPLCVGYSNHVKGCDVAALSVVAGASVVECHFMLDGDDCVDAPVSLTPSMFKAMALKIENYEAILGESKLCLSECEKPALAFKRKS